MYRIAETSEGASRPSQQQVRDQLDRILQSANRRLPARSLLFFQFVVEETLAGRQTYLKAFTIALAVFGRNASFDPQTDPCVRIVAGRIRSELERYYLTDGRFDPVQIFLPKGGYVPVFTWRGEECDRSTFQNGPKADLAERQEEKSSVRDLGPVGWLSQRRRWWVLCAFPTVFSVVAGVLWHAQHDEISSVNDDRQIISIAPLTPEPNNAMASSFSEGITDQIITQLVRHPKVIVKFGSATRPGSSDRQRTYTLQGTVGTEDKSVWTSIQLVREKDGVIVLATNLQADLATKATFVAQAALANSVVSLITGPDGAFQHGSAEPDTLAAVR